MTSKTILSLTIFAIIILFTGTISPTLLFTEADALKAKTNYKHVTNSKKVCGDDLCASGQTPHTPKGLVVLPDSVSYENSDIQMSFVQSAPSGTFEIKDGRQILTLNDISPTTIYFSDRPDRITGFLETELFFALWGEGENSFASNPPNAALELIHAGEHSDIFILELSNPIYNVTSNTLQYDVIILDNIANGLTQNNKTSEDTIPETFEYSVLFIDSLGSWWKKTTSSIEKPIVKFVSPIISKPINTVVTKSAESGAAMGGAVGGKEGTVIGSNLGADMGESTVKSSEKAILRSDSNSDVFDISKWENDIDKPADPDTIKLSKSEIATYVTYNFFKEQGKNIEKEFLSLMNGLRDIPELTASYDANSFCGTTNEKYFKDRLYPVVLYNLKYALYSTILDDLNKGMSHDDIKIDISDNFKNKIKKIIIYSLLHINDSCKNDDAGTAALISTMIESTYKINSSSNISEYTSSGKFRFSVDSNVNSGYPTDPNYIEANGGSGNVDSYLPAEEMAAEYESYDLIEESINSSNIIEEEPASSDDILEEELVGSDDILEDELVSSNDILEEEPLSISSAIEESIFVKLLDLESYYYDLYPEFWSTPPSSSLSPPRTIPGGGEYLPEKPSDPTSVDEDIDEDISEDIAEDLIEEEAVESLEETLVE